LVHFLKDNTTSLVTISPQNSINLIFESDFLNNLFLINNFILVVVVFIKSILYLLINLDTADGLVYSKSLHNTIVLFLNKVAKTSTSDISKVNFVNPNTLLIVISLSLKSNIFSCIQ